MPKLGSWFPRLVIVAGLLATLTWVAQFNRIAEYDEALHLDVARNIYRNGVPIRSIGNGEAYLYHPPLYLYTLAPLTGPLVDGTLVGRWVTAAFGLFTVMLTFRLGTDLGGETASLIAGALVAVSPLFQTYAFNIQAEAMLAALILAGLLVFVRGHLDGQMRYTWLAGILFALAVWIKFLAVIPIVACALFALLQFKRRRLLYCWVALSVPVVLALALWVIFGMWLDRAVFLSVMRDWFSGPQWPWDARTHFTLTGWLTVVARDVLSYPLTFLLLATLPWRFRVYRHKTSVLLLELYTGLMLIYTAFVSVKEVRHLIPLIPVVAILASIGIAEFLRAWHWPIRPAWQRAILIGLAAIFFVEASPLTLVRTTWPSSARDWLDVPYAVRVFGNDPYLTNVRDAGQYLNRTMPKDAIIPVVHEGTVTGYYADRRYILLYVLSYDWIAQVLADTDWLLVDKDLYPNLSADEIQKVKAYIAEHFEPVARFEKVGPPAIVYRRKPAP